VLVRALAALVVPAVLLAGAAGPAVASAPAAVASPVVAATGDVTWSLAPADGPLGTGRANFAYEVAPGDVVHDAVVVTNLTDAELPLDAYATDAFTTPAGHLDLLPADAPAAGLGNWLTLDVPGDDVVVGPRASLTVPFTIAVPADASPGDHAAGVVTSYLSAATGATVARDNRLALRVHARVAGELVPGLRVDDVRVRYQGTANPAGSGRAVVTYTVTNTGNVRVLPVASVGVAGPGGVGARDVVTELPEVLAGSTVEAAVEVPGVLPAFVLTATVAVTGETVGIGGGDLAADRAAASVAAVPWSALALLLVVVAGAVVVGLRGGGRVRRAAADGAAADGAGADGEDRPDDDAPTAPGADAPSATGALGG
jgi:hypothetical protein